MEQLLRQKMPSSQFKVSAESSVGTVRTLPSTKADEYCGLQIVTETCTLMGDSLTEAGVCTLHLLFLCPRPARGPCSALRQVPRSWFYFLSSRCQKWGEMPGLYLVNFPLILQGIHGKPHRALSQLLLFPASVKIRLLLQDPFQHCPPASVFQPRQTSVLVSPKRTMNVPFLVHSLHRELLRIFSFQAPF